MHSDDSQPPRKATELPSYTLDDDSPRGWRAWFRGVRLLVLILILALLALVGFGAKPLYQEIKVRRALALAEKAGAALDANDIPQASSLLRQAALMAFHDPRVAARVTFHAARSGDMASVIELGKKLDAKKASPEEVLVFGEASLATGNLANAIRAHDALPKELPAPQAVRSSGLLAGILLLQNKAPDAIAVMREAIATTPSADADALRVMLANLLLKDQKSVAVHEEILTLLEQASTNSGQEGVSALRLLAVNQIDTPPTDHAALAKLLDRLRAHPAYSSSDEIFIVRLLTASDSENKEPAIADLVTRLNAGPASIEVRTAAARWLVANRANEAVLDLITEKDAALQTPALMTRLDALNELGRLNDTEQLIETNHGGTLPEPYYHLFRARIAESREDASTADAEKRLLRQSIQFAEPSQVAFVANYAESVGWKPEAFAAWRILAADHAFRSNALRGQLRNLPPSLPASDGVDISTDLLALEPNDPSARLSAAYFRLLAGQMIDDSAATVEELLSAEPHSIDVRRVAALARLRTGKATQGLIILPESDNDPRWLALQAALLRAAGRLPEAKRIAAQINRDSLNPDEQNLLQGL